MRPQRERGKQPPRRFAEPDFRELAEYRKERMLLALMRGERRVEPPRPRERSCT